MRMRKTWQEEMKDLKKLGYKFDEDGYCILDPTATQLKEMVKDMVKAEIVEPGANLPEKVTIVEAKVKPKIIVKDKKPVVKEKKYGRRYNK